MLYIVSAPSGAGKTSLVRALVQRCQNLVISVSYTTRPMRVGEVDGVNYHFVSEAQFNGMIRENQFLEYAKVFGYAYLYGTSKKWVCDALALGKDVILEIDWQGAQQIRKIFSESISIFIVPPSIDILQQRLENRAQDSPEIIQKRMGKVRSECQHLDEFDYLVINDDFEVAVQDLKTIVLAQRLRVAVQQKVHEKLLNKLISV